MTHAAVRRNALSCAIVPLAALVSAHAQAQTATPDEAKKPAVQTLETVTVRASADASAGGLKAPYAGGQVARGGRVLGGAINGMAKRAPNAALNEVTLGIESGGQAYVAADVARRFGLPAIPAAPACGSTRCGATAAPRSTTRSASSACSRWARTG